MGPKSYRDRSKAHYPLRRRRARVPLCGGSALAKQRAVGRKAYGRWGVGGVLDGEFGGDADQWMEEETEQERSSNEKGYRRSISVKRGVVSGRGHGQRWRGRVGYHRRGCRGDEGRRPRLERQETDSGYGCVQRQQREGR